MQAGRVRPLYSGYGTKPHLSTFTYIFLLTKTTTYSDQREVHHGDQGDGERDQRGPGAARRGHLGGQGQAR